MPPDPTRTALIALRAVTDPYESFEGNGDACRFCFARRAQPHRECIWEAAALLVGEGLTQEWQPIETAPKDGTRVWLWNGYRRTIGWHAHHEDSSSGWHRQSLIHEPLGKRDIDPETHWLPLPAPPAERALNAPVRWTCSFVIPAPPPEQEPTS